MKKIFIFLILLKFGIVSAQNTRYNDLISKVFGDLNNDKIKDIAMIYQDKKTKDCQLQIYIAVGKKYTLSTYSNSAIKYNTENGNSFDKINIENGILIINYDLQRGNEKYKFRFQNSNFELIGYENNSSDGNGTSEQLDYNLSTGKRIITKINYENDKEISKETKIIKMKILPKLSSFDSDLFNPYPELN